jgi:predicted RNA binding protein YcfA (HicA-like mRNA interferase family)
LKLPRDLSGEELARLLRKYNYEVTRQTGSHMRLTSRIMGSEHHITIPAHKDLRVGTLASILEKRRFLLESQQGRSRSAVVCKVKLTPLASETRNSKRLCALSVRSLP